MPTITEFHVKNFNPEKLDEELVSGLGVGRIYGKNWFGFHRLSKRILEPNSATEQYGTMADGTQLFADPGELHIHVPEDFSAAEETTLSSILTAHDFSLLTAEQQRQDVDVADWQALRNNYADYRDGNLNPANRLIYEGKMARLLLRIGRKVLADI